MSITDLPIVRAEIDLTTPEGHWFPVVWLVLFVVAVIIHLAGLDGNDATFPFWSSRRIASCERCGWRVDDSMRAWDKRICPSCGSALVRR